MKSTFNRKMKNKKFSELFTKSYIELLNEEVVLDNISHPYSMKDAKEFAKRFSIENKNVLEALAKK